MMQVKCVKTDKVERQGGRVSKQRVPIVVQGMMQVKCVKTEKVEMQGGKVSKQRVPIVVQGIKCISRW